VSDTVKKRLAVLCADETVDSYDAGTSWSYEVNASGLLTVVVPGKTKVCYAPGYWNQIEERQT
jgi:hypothetical protein